MSSYHISWTAACWLFLCYFRRMWSNLNFITNTLASRIWNLNVVTVMALMLLESLRMSSTRSKSVILLDITGIHNHFRFKWLIYDMGIIALARQTVYTHISLKWLMHEWLRAKIWSRWHFFLAVDLTRWWSDWSTSSHTSTGIGHKRLVLGASSVSSHSIWIHCAERSTISIIYHTISMCFAA